MPTDQRGTILDNARMTGSHLSHLDLDRAVFRHVNLADSEFEWINITGARFKNTGGASTPATDVRFEQYTMQRSRFLRGDMSESVFRQVNLRHVRFEECQWEGATIDGVEVAALVPSVPLPADETLPAEVVEYLAQARSSLQAPLGAMLLVRQAVERMLQLKGYEDGTLLDRLRQVAEGGDIPLTLVQWAAGLRWEGHEPLPRGEDARQGVEFAQVLSQYVFGLPVRIARGLAVIAQANAQTEEPPAV